MHLFSALALRASMVNILIKEEKMFISTESLKSVPVTTTEIDQKKQECKVLENNQVCFL